MKYKKHLKFTCNIIPIDSYGNLRHIQDAVQVALYFTEQCSLDAFILENADRILGGARLDVEETCTEAS